MRGAFILLRLSQDWMCATVGWSKAALHAQKVFDKPFITFLVAFVVMCADITSASTASRFSQRTSSWLRIQLGHIGSCYHRAVFHCAAGCGEPARCRPEHQAQLVLTCMGGPRRSTCRLLADHLVSQPPPCVPRVGHRPVRVDWRCSELAVELSADRGQAELCLLEKCRDVGEPLP